MTVGGVARGHRRGDRPTPFGRPVTRRTFLIGAAATGLVACTNGSGGDDSAGSTTTSAPDIAVPRLDGDPFTLGVASGDPLPDSVVLWTRLAVDPQTVGGAMPRREAPVQWVLATDERLRDPVQEGTFVASPGHAHSVHVDVGGLDPAATYWYGFRIGDYESPVGRTRTAPAADSSPERLRFASASCQAYQTGYFTPYGQMAEEDLDFVVFHGDYMYEREASTATRPHGLEAPATLDEFRVFYGLNKSDADLQAAHAAFPWVVLWDDHEVEDNYAALDPGAIGEAADPETARADFTAKVAAAYQAWWEHQPVRIDPPDGTDLRIYRSFRFGDLIDLAVVDNRQYRTQPPETEEYPNLPRPLGGGPQLPGAFDPDATLFGEEQESWLGEFLAQSDARWTVLGQQSIMAEIDRAPDDPNKGYSMDSWDGYVAARDRLLATVQHSGVDNFVSIGGDIHTSAVTDLHADYKSNRPEVVGTEFVVTSVSSLELLPDGYVTGSRANPHVRLYDIEHRGYLRCEATPDELRADFRYVTTTDTPDAEPVDGTSWVVESGRPGATPA